MLELLESIANVVTFMFFGLLITAPTIGFFWLYLIKGSPIFAYLSGIALLLTLVGLHVFKKSGGE